MQQRVHSLLLEIKIIDIKVFIELFKSSHDSQQIWTIKNVVCQNDFMAVSYRNRLFLLNV